MNEERLFGLKRTGVLVIAIGLFVFLLYLYFFVPFGGFIARIRQADPLYYSLAFVSMLLSMVFYSLTWQHLLHLLSVKSSFLKTLQFVCVGGFVDLLVPAESISGDITRAYLMSREHSENAGKVVASVVGHRILAMFITLGSLAISSVYFAIKYNPPIFVTSFMGLLGMGTLISMILLFYLSRRRQATDKVVNWLIGFLVRVSRGHWKFEDMKKPAEKMVKAFHDGIDTLTVRPSRLVLPLFLGILAMFLDFLIAFLVFFALKTQVSFIVIIIVYTISMSVQTLPVGFPWEIGGLDIVMTSLYTLLGIDITVSAVATILIRILTLWLRLLIGGLAVQWLGIKVFKTSRTPS